MRYALTQKLFLILLFVLIVLISFTYFKGNSNKKEENFSPSDSTKSQINSLNSFYRKEGLWVLGEVVDRETLGGDVYISINSKPYTFKVLLGSVTASKVGVSYLSNSKTPPFHSADWTTSVLNGIDKDIVIGKKIAILLKTEIPNNADSCNNPFCRYSLEKLRKHVKFNSSLKDFLVSPKEGVTFGEIVGPVTQLVIYK